MAEKNRSPKLSLERALPYLLIIVGVIGMICSFIITQDKFKLLENPHFIPSCNLNPVVSCGSVMKTPQASAFGFPNPIIGLIGFAATTTVGAAMLAGGRFKRWFWLCFEVGMVLGLAFAYWLLFQSVYRIKALCPYCLTVDVVLITGTWYLTLYLFDRGFLRVPKGKTAAAYAWIRRHHLDLLVLWFLILIGLILKHFWYYYGQHL